MHTRSTKPWAFADPLDCSVSPEGTIYDLRFVNIPVIARHLARAGIGPVAGQAVIRPVDAPGSYRQWIDIDAPDPTPVDVDNTTLSDLDPDDPRVRALLAERFGGADFAPPPPPGSDRPSCSSSSMTSRPLR